MMQNLKAFLYPHTQSKNFNDAVYKSCIILTYTIEENSYTPIISLYSIMYEMRMLQHNRKNPQFCLCA